jgi:hypothetical protein
VSAAQFIEHPPKRGLNEPTARLGNRKNRFDTIDTPSYTNVAMSSAKQDVEQLLNKLPDDCSVEDIQYHLYVLDKVRQGLEDARLNGTIPQDEVEARLSKWLTE